MHNEVFEGRLGSTFSAFFTFEFEDGGVVESVLQWKNGKFNHSLWEQQ